MGRDVSFSLNMYVLGAVEIWGATWPDAVGAEDLDRLLFKGFVRDEVVEIVGREICYCTAVGEFRLGPRWSASMSILSQVLRCNTLVITRLSQGASHSLLLRKVFEELPAARASSR